MIQELFKDPIYLVVFGIIIIILALAILGDFYGLRWRKIFLKKILKKNITDQEREEMEYAAKKEFASRIIAILVILLVILVTYVTWHFVR